MACKCSHTGLEGHGLSLEVQNRICSVLNGFDAEGRKHESLTVRQEKIAYGNTLEGEEKLFAFCWIRFQ